ncbi:MAG: dihydropteroate synthase [Synergistaceae bacterium]|nr:dihydropteroate synthase [Synergistaceae bacterium]
MTVYNMKFIETSELADALRAIGADMRSLPFFSNRREIRILFVSNADVRAANVIKQEILSRGGDAAVNAHVIDCGVAHSDVILFGTRKQLELLADKLETMAWWGLPDISKEIRRAIAALSRRRKTTVLPSGAVLKIGARTLIMGIINLTDDSFYRKSRTGGSLEETVKRALQLAEEGADILDLGAESTRPGSARVPEDIEKERIVAAVKEIRKLLPSIPLSIDTTRASVARSALEAGADIINDVSGLTYEPEIAKAASDFGAMLVLMHMRGTPETMQSMCGYDNILLELTQFFEKGIDAAGSFGLDRSRIIIDPGIGFAKTYDQNLFILRHLEAFETLGLPLLIGVSRKGTIGRATESEYPEERLEGTIAVSTLCAWQGVDMIRVHDVAQNRKAVMMTEAIKGAKYA